MILHGSKKISNLTDIEKKYKAKKLRAQNGQDSARYRLVGEDGKDLRLGCPVGCTILGQNENVIGEINKESDEICIPIGGQGGRKENGFFGQKGRRQALQIDLKLISDIG